MARKIQDDAPPAELFVGLLEEEDAEARQAYLGAHPELRQRSTASRLLGEVNRLLRVDLERAEGLAATIVRLAEELDDDECRGYAHRAAGNVEFYRRDLVGSLAKYEAALELFQSAGNELEVGRTHNTVVSCLGLLGDYDRAHEAAAKASAIFARLGDHKRLGIVENNLGVISSRRGRLQEALEHYRSAYGHFVEAGTPSDVGIALRNIAVAHQDLYDLPAALEAYGRARAWCEEHGLQLVGLEVDYNIAYLHYLRGEYTLAIGLFEEARRSAEELEDHLHTALCDLDQAELFLELNLVQEAARLARRASRGYRELGMQYDMAKALAFEAMADHRRRQPQSALELLESARQVFVRHENRVWTAMTDLYRSLVLFETGRVEEAGRLAADALEVCSGSGIETRTAMCEMMLARVRLAEDGTEQAGRLCASALGRLEAVGMPALEFQAHYLTGRIEESMESPEEALDAYRRAHLTLERLRARLGTEEIRISFLDDKQSVYESLVRLTLERGAGAADLEAAFGYIETAKSRSLADLLAFRAPSLPAKRAAARELAEEIKTLRQELNSYYHLVDLEEKKGGERSLEKAEKLRESAKRRERRLVRTLRTLQTADPEYRSLQDSVTADLDSIRSALPPETTLLEYFVARGTIYACVVDPESLRIEPVSETDRVQGIHRHLQLQLGKFRNGPEYVERFAEMMHRSTESCLSKMYRELVAPIEGHLRGRHLIVVPHGFLHHVPLHALYDGESYLCDRFSISYAPSASVFCLCSRKESAAGDSALVLGVADERAPLILDEARAVAETLPGSKLLVGEEATAEALRELGQSCRYLHVATHGFYRKDNPMFSAIQLGDARLSLFDLYDLELDAELAVLSGCGTGLGTVQGADELVGLTRGLLYAGALAVLVTLWDVNDESTALFMRDLYARLTDGVAPAEALRRSAAKLRESFPHPYYWAPFVLIGKPAGENRRPDISNPSGGDTIGDGTAKVAAAAHTSKAARGEPWRGRT